MNGRYKVWVEIRQKAVEANVRTFQGLLKPKTKLWAVVKSNAYGHGLVTFSVLADQEGVDGFCVDSVVEGVKLRNAGVRKPILVLGPTLSEDFIADAFANNITITAATKEALELMAKSKTKPQFHLKLDTGMHRQGFYVADVPKVIQKLKTCKLSEFVTGAYTHFASAKDLNYPTFSEQQEKEFGEGIALLRREGYTDLACHAAATGGALMGRKYHHDAVRIGGGLYGFWPSKELELQVEDVTLEPVLSWRAAVSEVKKVAKGGFIGYDLTERAAKDVTIAVIPIGYWHGVDRGLSGVGEVLIRGKRARILGRVSMDLIVVDGSDAEPRVYDAATLIGENGRESIPADDVGRRIGTSQYEILTRINPLIERIVV
jgi:alanine racemase